MPPRKTFILLLVVLLNLTACRTSPRAEITPLETPQPTVSAPEPTPAVQPVVPVEVPPPQSQPEKVIAIPPPKPVVSQSIPPQNVPAPVPQPPIVRKPAIAPNYKWSRVPVEGPYIALTFDDGPNPKNTPALLDILKERHIPATFFVLGPNAAAYPSVLERMAAEGHEIAIHGWDHASFVAMTVEERAMQVQKAKEAIKDAVGRVPTLVRPPYGATTLEMNRWFAEQMKMTVVLWSVDSKDWQSRDPVQIKKTILADTKPGAIVLAHDIYRTTVSAMPATLDALIAKGYKFVTVSDLISLPLAK